MAASLATLALIAGSAVARSQGAAAGGTDDVELQEVTVTGSLVIRNGNESPTPVTVVTIEDMQATRPTTVFEGLTDLPIFAGSKGATTEMRGAGGSNNNTSSLNLRGLGPNRTLVLYDGHRFPPSNQNGFVDANLIPQLLLQRVDVVTGGASAVYGSDAIGGVVNFITDRSFNGVKSTLQVGRSSRNDDPSHEVGIAFGTQVGSRGHFEASYQRHYDKGILHRTDRASGRPRYALQGSGTTANPYFLTTGTTYSNMSFGGKIVGPTNNPLRNLEFSSNGVLTPFVGTTDPALIGNIQYGGSGAYQTAGTLKAALELNQVYGRYDFDWTDSLHAYASIAGTEDHSSNNSLNNRIIAATLSATNAFLPVNYQQQMAAAGVTTFTYGKNWLENSVAAQHVDVYTRNYLANVGLDGSLGSYKWETNYAHSLTKFHSRENNNLNNPRLSAALDAVTDSTGQIVCRVTVTNPGLYPGCAPLNVFGPSSESNQAASYILSSSPFESKLVMDDVSALLTGAPVSTWAGPVSMALSADWRHLSYELASGALPITDDPVSCTGLRFNCTASTPRWQVSTSNRPPVGMSVAELALEANLPLVKDLPLARQVDLDLAYRYASYRVRGNPVLTDPKTTTKFQANIWKVGLHWKMTDSVTLRATRSRDFRAPNLNDLYDSASLTVNSGNIDVLTGITPTALAQSGGNPNLTPEIGLTTTVGVVWAPGPAFSIALDGYDITVTNAIANIAGTNRLSQLACYASGGSSFYCTLQERPFGCCTNNSPANAVTKWYSRPINIAKQTTSGIDLEVNFKTAFRDHPFSLRGLVSYQPHDVIVTPGLNDVDYSGVAFNNQNQAGAVMRLTGLLRYALTKRLTVDWQTRWRDSLHYYGDPTIVVQPPDYVSSMTLSNLNVSYRMNWARLKQSDLYLNVQNVFDKEPSPTANTAAATEPGRVGGSAPGDDVIGRYYSLGVRIRL